MTLSSRRAHEAQVIAFLQREIAGGSWAMALPHGSGHETYFARSCAHDLFVKLGTNAAPARALAVAGIGPAVLLDGSLYDGTPILVQPRISSRRPTPADFQARLAQVTALVRRLHHGDAIRATLAAPAPRDYRAAGLAAVSDVRRRWQLYRPTVPTVTEFVDTAFDQLTHGLAHCAGEELVAAHGDICNANWLLTPDDQLYMIDTDMLHWDDPAADLGPLLWWYYPPQQRALFLNGAGYADNPALRERLRLRTALHCLSIILPRDNSFDSFDPATFPAALTDFRAALNGAENPQGY